MLSFGWRCAISVDPKGEAPGFEDLHSSASSFKLLLTHCHRDTVVQAGSYFVATMSPSITLELPLLDLGGNLYLREAESPLQVDLPHSQQLTSPSNTTWRQLERSKTMRRWVMSEA